MAVYVDALRATKTTASWPYRYSAHLLADSIEELHAFAESIGMRREWFQPGSTPHYDVTSARHRQAIAAGAKLLNRFELVELIKRLRAQQVRVTDPCDPLEVEHELVKPEEIWPDHDLPPDRTRTR